MHLRSPLDPVWNVILVEHGAMAEGKEAVLAYPRVKAGKVNIADVSFLAVQRNGVRPSGEERIARTDREIELILLDEGLQLLVLFNVLPKLALPFFCHGVTLTAEHVSLEAFLLQQFLHGEAIHGIDSGTPQVTCFMDMLETPVELEHGAIFSQAVHLGSLHMLFPAVKGMPYVVPFPPGYPVQPAESNGGLVVSPVTLWQYDEI